MIARGMVNGNTNGSTNTQSPDLADNSIARTGKARMSFLKRLQTQPQPPPLKEEEAILTPVLNVNGVKSITGSVSKKDTDLKGRKRGKSGSSEAGSERSRSKENRLSFFSGGSLAYIGRGRGSNGDFLDEKAEEIEWITQSDLAGSGGGYRTNGNTNGTVEANSFGGRRSTSSARPKTGGSQSQSISRDGSVGKAGSTEGGGGGLGSVRKRFSMLKLGKKSSKASVLVDSVTEED
jgi:dedicator of cytokinesis protein 3